jgi:hypothetical protein
MGIFMSSADGTDTQERLHMFHPEVQKCQLDRTHAPSAYIPYSSHALARGRFVPEFPGPLRLILRLHMAQKSI